MQRRHQPTTSPPSAPQLPRLPAPPARVNPCFVTVDESLIDPRYARQRRRRRRRRIPTKDTDRAINKPLRMNQEMYSRIRQLQRAGHTYRQIIQMVGAFSPRTIHQVVRNKGPYQISRLRKRGWQVDDQGDVIGASTGVD